MLWGEVISKTFFPPFLTFSMKVVGSGTWVVGSGPGTFLYGVCVLYNHCFKAANMNMVGTPIPAASTTLLMYTKRSRQP